MYVTLDLDIGINNNKNENKTDNLKSININDFNNNKQFINNSFSDLTLSDIGNKDKNSIQFSQRSSHNKISENEDLNNYILKEIEKRNSLESVKIEDFNNLFKIEKKKQKLTKEDLNNIPLPIFSCIYCSNEKVVFNHLLNEIISKKYLLLTSKYDMKVLTKIISYKYLKDKNDKNDKLEDIIIKNTEYIHKYYCYDELKQILSLTGNDNTYSEMYHKKIMNQIENILNVIKLKKIKRDLNKPPTNLKKFNHYYSFNNNIINNNLNNYSSINNSTDEFIFNKKNNPNNINQTISNLSVSNFNSVSLINYLDNNNQKEKENRFKLDDIIEQIEKKSNIEYSGFDLSRKITKEEIEWENEYYNIWTPKIDLLFTKIIPSTSKKNFNKIGNKTFIKIKKRNKSHSKNGEKNNSNSKTKYTRIQSRGKENLIFNISYQKNNYQKIKSKRISNEKEQILKKHTITHLITHSGSKNYNKNILINLNSNNTSKKKNKVKNKINKLDLINKNVKSHKCLKQYPTTISLNIKKKMNPINLFNSSKSKNNPINNQIIKTNKSTKNINKNNKINFGKSKNKSKNSKQKDYSNRNINKINNIKYISQNSSVTNKKIEIINTLPKYINKIKRNIINLTNKISRNNTYQNLDNIKEKSVIINISKDCSFDPQIENSHNKTKTKLANNNKSKKRISKINKNKNEREKEKKINNNIHIKKKKNNMENKLNYLNKITNDKNIYDIKILAKKNIEIKTKINWSRINYVKYNMSKISDI